MKYEVISEFVSKDGKRVRPGGGPYETTRQRGEKLVRAKCLRPLEDERATAPKAEKATTRTPRKKARK